jgi:hypothetical protein
MQVSKWSLFEKVVAVWVLSLFSVVVVSVFVALGLWISDNSNNVASWVQAVGAIVAIAAGAAAVNWQVRTQARHAEELRLERVKAVANALFNCRLALIAFLHTTLGWKDATRHADMALWWLRSLEAVPLQEFPYYRVQTIVGLVLSEARAFIDVYPDYRKLNDWGPFKVIADSDTFASLNKCGNALVSRLEEAEFAVEAYLQKQGTTSPEAFYVIDGKTYRSAGNSAVAQAGSGKFEVGFGIQLSERRQV